MAIYGTALLSFCLICGLVVGKLIGLAIGVDANVGGVGFAMLLLIVLSDRLRAAGVLAEPTQRGVLYWSAIYIPIVVAMAATQNVYAAISSGAVAIVAGAGAVVIGLAMLPLVALLGRSDSDESWPAGPTPPGDPR
ncbi:Malonate transporter MadL subunit [Posidoniimonas polymericola]|uniref:Malonate transporter MadL subunit n=1 Tax=Posidoniimonas polymericola TaxID=2528002 RepID=A0A5C5YT52_9BACT|nr:malonate transporter subunit MadL [Posidoniimonas polymericola]TWT78128.1 Malonate transporter MadL subunit [Posidoniimonas polymericola]